jgi:hypothetical protein
MDAGVRACWTMAHPNEPGADPSGRARGGPVRFIVAVELSDAGADPVRSLLEDRQPTPSGGEARST